MNLAEYELEIIIPGNLIPCDLTVYDLLYQVG
jgi:hypothetical protein